MSLRYSLTTALLGTLIAATAPLDAQRATAAPEVLLRLDDVGMNHSVNMAIAKVAETGMPFSVSVMFACPWYQEAVEILRNNPQIAVGVHLTLNSEWRNYRWGPVLGKAGAPSLVDSVGYFLPSTKAFLDSKYDLGEVERELNAQLERAKMSGLKITYVDFHMGTAGSTPELRAVVERLAKRYGVGISRSYGEASHTMFDTPIEAKKTEFLAQLGKADPSKVNLFVVHVAARMPEMEVLFDRNNATQNSEGGVPLVARHRASELEMLLSPEFAELRRSGKVRLTTYRDLAARASSAPRM
jgi:chitin disaccharide deacetylase